MGRKAPARARLLVEGFVQASTLDLGAWIAPLRERWLQEVGAGPFPWYTESKIEQGAFSTFLGLTLTQTDAGGEAAVVWNAVAVGDSCVFQVRDDRCICKFPVERHEDFDNAPGLVCSRFRMDEHSLERTIIGNACVPGDTLYLMTDALAAWFLKCEAEGATPWGDVPPFSELSVEEQTEPFEAWIERLRETHDFRNDDVTLLVIGF